MRIVHLSDLHLTSPAGTALGALRGKRWTGYASWWRKRRWQHRREVLDRLALAVQAEQPDRIVITGDLTHIGLPTEIAAARTWLQSLGPPERVCLVPGNHDDYARDSWSAIRRDWADYLHLHGNLPDMRHGDAYPVVREHDGVALVGLNSALPTPMLLARGRLGAAQCERLDATLAALNRRGLLSCLLIHHPPLRGMTSWRKALADAEALAPIMTRQTPALVLHGHLHRNLEARIGATRVFATASASSAMAEHPASYRVFDLARDEHGWQITMALKQASVEGADFVTVQRERWSHPQPAHAAG